MISPLLVDVSPWQPRPNWAVLEKLGPPWHGAIVKVSEGLSVATAKGDTGWFERNFRAVREVGGDRYGLDWFRGGYHFLRFDIDGTKQADVYLAAIEKAGGFAVGDLWPIVDVELGGEKHPNHNATALLIEATTLAFVTRVRAASGRPVMLYGNGAMRDKGIKSRMGCDWLWCPRYTAELPRTIYERAGWTAEQLVAWQYTDGTNSELAGHPKFPPGFGPCDVSAVVLAGGIERLRSLLWAERPS